MGLRVQEQSTDIEETIVVKDPDHGLFGGWIPCVGHGLDEPGDGLRRLPRRLVQNTIHQNREVCAGSLGCGSRHRLRIRGENRRRVPFPDTQPLALEGPGAQQLGSQG
jgi:hypothetical protein